MSDFDVMDIDAMNALLADVGREEVSGERRLAHITPSGVEWQPLSEVEMHSIVFTDWPLIQQSAFHLVV